MTYRNQFALCGAFSKIVHLESVINGGAINTYKAKCNISTICRSIRRYRFGHFNKWLWLNVIEYVPHSLSPARSQTGPINYHYGSTWRHSNLSSGSPAWKKSPINNYHIQADFPSSLANKLSVMVGATAENIKPNQRPSISSSIPLKEMKSPGQSKPTVTLSSANDCL